MKKMFVTEEELRRSLEVKCLSLPVFLLRIQIWNVNSPYRIPIDLNGAEDCVQKFLTVILMSETSRYLVKSNCIVSLNNFVSDVRSNKLGEV